MISAFFQGEPYQFRQARQKSATGSLPMRKTKIICTIGPATDSFPMLEKMAAAGMDVVRLNMSHGTHEACEKVIKSIRTLNRKMDTPVAVLLDTQGPEIRTGDLANDLELKNGSRITISVRDSVTAPCTARSLMAAS